jgi:protein-S-isoprenylcysteine O-methyltransferase Ste14
MPTPTKQLLATFFYFVSGLASVIISLFVNARLPISKAISWSVGLILFLAGWVLAIWALAHIKSAALAEIEPKLDHLLRRGPYRHVRHPIYLGAIIALIGMAVIMRSWLGFAAVLFLFMPSVIFRAKLEDKVLHRKFAAEWDGYAACAGFLLPRL